MDKTLPEKIKKIILSKNKHFVINVMNSCWDNREYIKGHGTAYQEYIDRVLKPNRYYSVLKGMTHEAFEEIIDTLIAMGVKNAENIKLKDFVKKVFNDIFRDIFMGFKREQVAANWLKKNGFQVNLARTLKIKYDIDYGIDLLAEDKDTGLIRPVQVKGPEWLNKDNEEYHKLYRRMSNYNDLFPRTSSDPFLLVVYQKKKGDRSSILQINLTTKVDNIDKEIKF